MRRKKKKNMNGEHKKHLEYFIWKRYSKIETYKWCYVSNEGNKKADLVKVSVTPTSLLEKGVAY